MKIFISMDMEGVAGVVAWNQVDSKDPEYQTARTLMIAEANAAVEGALEGGASEVVVNDSHGGMRNLLLDKLHPRARLISGSLKPQGMVAGLDASFAACFFVGYHSRAGNFGVLSHTWSGSATSVRVGDREFSEAALNATVAGHYGVPVALVTGDDRCVAEAREYFGDIETVTVKRALSRYGAENLPHAEACALIRRAAARAAAGTLAPFRPAPPLRLEIDFRIPAMADAAATMPGAERAGGLTVAYTARDGLELYRAFAALMDIASTES